MVKQQRTQENEPGKLNRLYNFVFQRRSWWLLGVAAWIGGFTWLIVHWSYAFSNPNERYSFIAQQMFNGLVFTAVVIQALIYGGQLRVMGVAFKPRLRITDVRIEDFEAGKEPVFIVSIKNDGATDAENVTLDIRVNLSEEGRIAVKWSNPQTVTISAGQVQHYFVPWRSPQTQERIDAFNTSVPIKVSGRFKLGDAEKEFCYRYYPWKGQRPEGVSQFVPCDFDTRLTNIITPGTAQLKITGHPPTIKSTINQITPTGDLTLLRVDEFPPNEPEATVVRRDPERNEKGKEAN